jgi:hypothetical protein
MGVSMGDRYPIQEDPNLWCLKFLVGNFWWFLKCAMLPNGCDRSAKARGPLSLFHWRRLEDLGTIGEISKTTLDLHP